MKVVISCRTVSKKDGGLYHTMDIFRIEHKIKTVEDFNILLEKIVEIHSELELDKDSLIVLFMKYFKK